MFQLVTETPGSLCDLWIQAQNGQIIRLGKHPNQSWLLDPITNLPILIMPSENMIRINAEGKVFSLGQHAVTDYFKFNPTSGQIFTRRGDALFSVLKNGKEKLIGEFPFTEWLPDPNGGFVFRLNNEFVWMNLRGKKTSTVSFPLQKQWSSWSINPTTGQVIILKNSSQGRLPPNREQLSVIFVSPNETNKRVGMVWYDNCGRGFTPDGLVIPDEDKFSLVDNDRKIIKLGRHNHDDRVIGHHVIIRRKMDLFTIKTSGPDRGTEKWLCDLPDKPNNWRVGKLGVVIEQPDSSFILVVIK